MKPIERGAGIIEHMARAQTEAVIKVEAALVALKDAIEDMYDRAA